MRKAALLLCMGALVFSGSAMAQGGGQQTPPPWDQVALRTFNTVHDKLIAIAKDAKFPADKESYKPHADSRNIVEELQHATAAVVANVERMKGGQPNFNDIVANLPKDRAGIAATLEKAKAEFVSLWDKDKRPGIIGLSEHAGEHYGKIVTIYRVNGLVPPGSRRGE